MTSVPRAKFLSILVDVACQVLETATFAFAELADAELPTSDYEDFLVSRLELLGDGHGTLVIAAPRELCCCLAADMSGMDIAVFNTEQASDLLGELTNMIAGRWATEAFGEQAVVHLGVPTSEILDAVERRAMSELPELLTLSIDDQPLLIDFQWESSCDGATPLARRRLCQ